jgi:hypothetical protein
MKKADRLRPMWNPEVVKGLLPEESMAAALMSHAIWLLNNRDSQEATEPSGHEGMTALEWAEDWLEDDSTEPWTLRWCCRALSGAASITPEKVRAGAERS